MLVDFFKRLASKLSESDAITLKLKQVLSHTSSVDLTAIEADWRERVTDDRRLAERVGLAIWETLQKVKLEREIHEALLGLKDALENTAFQDFGSLEDQYQSSSDADKSSSSSIISVRSLTSSSSTHANGQRLPKKVLSLLSSAKNEDRHPKFEDFRTKLIRGQNRTIREFLKGYGISRVPKHAIDEGETEAYERLKAYFLENQADLDGSTATLPNTNKNRPTPNPQPHSTEFSSFNDAYCKHILTFQVNRRYFQLYVDFVFSGIDCEKKCKRLGARCCSHRAHDQNCEQVWEQVKVFAREGILQALGLSA